MEAARLNGVVKLPGSTAARSVLCYPCAVRMSIMHQMPPPPPVSQVRCLRCAVADTVRGEDEDLFLDEFYHPHFLIIYETVSSASRFLEASTVVGCDIIGCPDLSLLCCACLGLYQFMDYVYAPIAAASVRTSPFIDSERLSVSVNVHRSISFLWLAVAALFYSVPGKGGEGPNPSALIPQEHSNFKDFFVYDFRASVLQYILYSHPELKGTKAPVGHRTYLQEIERRAKEENGVTQPRTVQSFTYSPDNDGAILEVCFEHNGVKDLANGKVVPPQYCSNRSDDMFTYSIIYDYVQPYLKSIGWWVCDDVDVSPVSMAQAKRFAVEGAATLCCNLRHSNIMLIGNYCKMRRDLSQSPWFVNGERVGTFSLQEIIANPILPFFFPEGVTSLPFTTESKGNGPSGTKRIKCEKTDSQVQRTCEEANDSHRTTTQYPFGYGRYKFHSAGREDVDVRMLGSGRPFVLEVISPSRQQVTQQDLQNFIDVVNRSEGGSVEISHLHLTDADITVRLARHSESKVKKYRCVVWCSRAIEDPDNDKHFQAVNSVRDLTIQQRTPIRVLHRRSMQVRPRTIHTIRLTPLNAHWFLMDLETQAGTYVKEFVHGDMGRTTPHLGSLMNGRTDIIQLDVLGMSAEGL